MPIIIAYILVGIFVFPFSYSNDGGARVYQSVYSKSHMFGRSLVAWPSYIFAWEPEVNGNSEKEFKESISKMLIWRNDKWFSSSKGSHVSAFGAAIGFCILSEGNEGYKGESMHPNVVNSNMLDKYRYTFGDGNNAILKAKVIKMLDGMDFKDVIDEGEECKEKIGL